MQRLLHILTFGALLFLLLLAVTISVPRLADHPTTINIDAQRRRLLS